jgi:exopolysaccharide biosynthesis polyprenyl glycosylphosphotransferase
MTSTQHTNDLHSGEIGQRMTGHATRRSLLRVLVGLDALVALSVLTVAFVIRFGTTDLILGPIDYRVVIPLVAVAWVLAIALRDGYDHRVLGEGADEYKRILEATFLAFATTAISAYALKVDVARGVIMAAFPIGAVLLCAERYVVRQWLVRRRAAGALATTTVVVGSETSARDLIRRLRLVPHLGFAVQGVVLLHGANRPDEVDQVPVIGCSTDPADLYECVVARRPDVLALTAAPELSPQLLRELAWRFEGSGIDLILAPGLAEVSAPRIRVQPAGGLTLLHLEEPAFRGSKKHVKAALDYSASAVLLLLLSPVLAVIALAIRATSPGPVLFRQARAGLNGDAFALAKFRTMYADAEHRLSDLFEQNETDGLLFKIKDDPRITPVGRWLRRFSLDELPQLWNVLRGDMSLVGPRPLPVNDEDFVGHERRRLLVKPGMTGLGQVSGRSELSWDETVRLDLYYVDNWSPSLDILILFRTLRAVLRRDGAY